MTKLTPVIADHHKTQARDLLEEVIEEAPDTVIVLCFWQTIIGTAISGNRVAHVIPVDDLRQHEETADCWCVPDLDYEHMIATHHSADNREAFETGERKAS